MAKVGDKVRIIKMKGEPSYNGKEGVIEKISPPYRPCGILEQWYGTWGGLAIQPDNDEVEIISGS